MSDWCLMRQHLVLSWRMIVRLIFALRLTEWGTLVDPRCYIQTVCITGRVTCLKLEANYQKKRPVLHVHHGVCRVQPNGDKYVVFSSFSLFFFSSFPSFFLSFSSSSHFFVFKQSVPMGFQNAYYGSTLFSRDDLGGVYIAKSIPVPYLYLF